MSDGPEQSDSFRDNLATVDKHGRRLWVYPSKPGGPFYQARNIVSFFLLLFLFGAPFIRLDGNPLLQFDIINRQFFIFGLAFWPHDFHLLVLATIALAVFVIMFTAIFGRLFCGWACPQTIFMELVFRRIEFWIEGSGPRQRRLNRADWTLTKLFKKSLKHTIFFAISFLIGNTFLAYIIGTEELRRIITSPPAEHLTGLVAMILFSLVFYYIFAFFREQVCTLVCPYGRLQSVMLDENSIVVAYDYKRGEPRQAFDRAHDRSESGDCVDCRACVRVCPTGIDIRNGTQLECVNCTACIDACDKIMLGLGWPKGLIRYSSHSKIETGQSGRSTARLVIYAVVLTILIGIVSIMMLGRADVETTILRASGSLYEELADGNIRNLYTIKIVNKTSKSLPLELRLKDGLGQLIILGPALRPEPRQVISSVFSIEIPKSDLYTSSRMIIIEVLSGGELVEEVRTNFAGP